MSIVMPGGNAHEGVCIAAGVAVVGGCEWRNENGAWGRAGYVVGVRGMCGPILNIIPACRTQRFCGRLSTPSCDCDHNGHSQY
jgi:hypothetical protein